MYSRLGPSFISLILFIIVRAAAAAQINRTIDDTIGDVLTGTKPIYAPSTSGVWEDNTCTGCALQPDRAKAFQGTWTAATYNPTLGSMSVTLSFKGTAIYVFFILANGAPDGITTLTECDFTLDGRFASSYRHVGVQGLDFEYNALVYSSRNLQNTDHKLVISTSGLDHNVWVSFDYAIYTFDDTPAPVQSPSQQPSQKPSPPPSSTSSTASTITPGHLQTDTAPSASGQSPSQTSPSNESNSNTSELPPAPSVPSAPSTPSGTSPGLLQTENPLSDSGSSDNGHKAPVGAIAGGAVGGFVGLVALALLVAFCLRRKRHNVDEVPAIAPFISEYQSNESSSIHPTMVASGSRYTDPSESEFIQDGTIMSPSTPGGLNHSTTYYDSPTMGQVSHSSNSIHHSDTLESRALSPPLNGQIMAPSNFATTNLTPLVPMRGNAHTSPNSATAAIRKARQEELDHQVRTVRQEMQDLKADSRSVMTRPPSFRSGTTRSDNTEMLDMREQIRIMRERIDYLQAQEQSAWARGLSDEPPPGYSARAPSMRR